MHTTLLSDVVSRLPLTDQVHNHRNVPEEYINYMATNVPKALTLAEISKATKSDPLLQLVQRHIDSNRWPGTPELQPFKRVKNELSFTTGLVLRGCRIVIPEGLRQRTLQNAHEGHQGMVRIKHMIRGNVWWPGVDSNIEEMIKACLPCQSVSSKYTAEPYNRQR